MPYNVTYIGNTAKISEYILFNENYNLKYLICEKDRVTDELLTFSLIRNIKLLLITNTKELIKVINNMENIDFFIVHSFGKKIPINKIKYKEFYNLHPSFLPFYKGRNPIFWATIKNEKFVGMTLHKINEYFDEGDIISQIKIPYYFWETPYEIEEKLLNYTPKLLNDLIKYKNGTIKSKKNKKGYYYPIFSEKDIIIDLDNDDFSLIYNKIRSQSSYKGAKIIFKNTILWIKQCTFTFINKNTDDKQHTFYIKNNYLFIHIRNNIWIKSNKFLLEKKQGEI
ncbi:formyltransferase family protein [Marinitoga sp. 1138]|uniref:formyltransferase family protein n=1 Tax=Marinitoga sp. 1138 TaxID=1643334 RepID=UPI001585E366|nr:formyltransferase family protein [Marinitoga sp. 1138]NUU97597.1 hypothetical protein [Marinitoga sp. 1138]